MFFVRKRSANVAAATDVFCAKAKRQQRFCLCESAATATAPTQVS